MLTLGFAFEANAHNTLFKSPFEIDFRRSSFAVIDRGSGSTKALSTYLAVMYLNRSSYGDCGTGLVQEFGTASHTELLILFDNSRNRLTRLGVKDVVSRVSDRIFVICDPKPRCTPPQSKS